jgi:co-chaperonin GroES (HSP10)
MNSIGDNLIVRYDVGHNRNVKIGDVTIEISRECNNDLKEGNDQRCVIVGVSKDEKWLKQGDEVFTHYLGSDKSNMFEYEGEKYWRIPRKNVFFKIKKDGSFEMNDGVYICSEFKKEAPKTESGIFLTPYTEKVEPMTLIVLHEPKDNKGIKVGDKIMSDDAYNYTFNYDGERFVKIDYHFIAGVYGEESTTENP